MEDFEAMCKLLDQRYVIRSDCSTMREQTKAEVTELKVQSADTNAKLNIIIKIGSAAAVAAVGAFGTAICSLIFK